MDRALPFLAIDLGAESGRGILGRIGDGRLRLEEVHRFSNQPVRLLDTLYWDFPRLFQEIRTALTQAASLAGGRLAAVGVDSWGVDYGLLDERGCLLSNPVHYRDARTDGAMEQVFRRVSREEIFERTGIQFIQLNTLFQLYAHRRDQAGVFSQARRLLPIADLVNYFLTGRAVSEYTIATTTQLLDVRHRTWCRPLLEALDLPADIFPEIIPPASVVGPLRDDIASECGLTAPPPVVAPACHDTAAAVAAVPAESDRGWAYLSSGTWSLLGIELGAPRVTPEALAGNFTNEGGAGGRVRFLRNIMGLWLVQECRRQWAREGRELDYDALAALAERAPPLASLVVPDDPDFFAPGDMPARIRRYCERTSQPVPASEGAILRTALESLALAYRLTVERIESVSGTRIERLHVVGGGSRNRLLNRFTASALERPVVAGPVEATASGNILLSAVALGYVADLPAVRRMVRNSFDTEVFPPEDPGSWEKAYQRFRELEGTPFPSPSTFNFQPSTP